MAIVIRDILILRADEVSRKNQKSERKGKTSRCGPFHFAEEEGVASLGGPFHLAMIVLYRFLISRGSDLENSFFSCECPQV